MRWSAMQNGLVRHSAATCKVPGINAMNPKRGPTAGPGRLAVCKFLAEVPFLLGWHAHMWHHAMQGNDADMHM